MLTGERKQETAKLFPASGRRNQNRDRKGNGDTRNDLAITDINITVKQCKIKKG
jgi:hypothetical protein